MTRRSPSHSVRLVLAAGLAIALAACSRDDEPPAGGRRSVSEVCPAPDSIRNARLAGALPNDSVDTRADIQPPAPLFRYPDELAQQRIGGRALADFVIDTTGLVDMHSIAVLESSDSRITEGVCLYLAGSRFNPAVEGGRKVRVRQRLPFNFQFGPPQ